MFTNLLFRGVLACVLVFAGAAGAILARDAWLPLFPGSAKEEAEEAHGHGDPETIQLSPQAFDNLGPNPQPMTLGAYSRTITLPAVVADRPGLSDRHVPAPIAGIVTRLHVEPGALVRSGDVLCSVRVTSEYMQTAQAALYKARSDMAINRDQRQRLLGGSVPDARLRELDDQYRRLEADERVHSQDLITRGFTPAQLDEVRAGRLIREVEVRVPEPLPGQTVLYRPRDGEPFDYEVQALTVEVGQSVVAGQEVVTLANHLNLLVEGRAFLSELPELERSAAAGWPISVRFHGDQSALWTRQPQEFHIRSFGNMIDPEKRILTFKLPLENEHRVLDGGNVLLWRYRPGQRAEVVVTVERSKEEDHLVVPATAVAREGPEAFVFVQNGDGFTRRPVRLIHMDQEQAVIRPRDDITPGLVVAFRGAAGLNRMLKAQAQGGGGHDHHGHSH